MLHGRLVGNWSSCWSSMRHCGSWCRHKPATRLKSMQPFFVINSTLIKVPCGKREKYEKTGNAGNPKKQKNIFSSIWWSGLWLLHLWFDRNFTRYRYISLVCFLWVQDRYRIRVFSKPISYPEVRDLEKERRLNASKTFAHKGRNSKFVIQLQEVMLTETGFWNSIVKFLWYILIEHESHHHSLDADLRC